MRIKDITEQVAHLGYPLYFVNFIGAGQLACAVALLVPRFPVGKERAYTGAFINYSSALASHLTVGDRPGIWILPLIMLVLLLASWALRPPDRRPQTAMRVGEIRPTAWLVPIVLLVVFAILAFLTLPGAGALRR